MLAVGSLYQKTGYDSESLLGWEPGVTDGQYRGICIYEVELRSILTTNAGSDNIYLRWPWDRRDSGIFLMNYMYLLISSSAESSRGVD